MFLTVGVAHVSIVLRAKLSSDINGVWITKGCSISFAS
jgi:hypothetical protein